MGFQYGVISQKPSAELSNGELQTHTGRTPHFQID
jgi:hypothetical protein